MGFLCGFRNVSPDKQAINKSIMLSSAKAIITHVIRRWCVISQRGACARKTQLRLVRYHGEEATSLLNRDKIPHVLGVLLHKADRLLAKLSRSHSRPVVLGTLSPHGSQLSILDTKRVLSPSSPSPFPQASSSKWRYSNVTQSTFLILMNWVEFEGPWRASPAILTLPLAFWMTYTGDVDLTLNTLIHKVGTRRALSLKFLKPLYKDVANTLSARGCTGIQFLRTHKLGHVACLTCLVSSVLLGKDKVSAHALTQSF